MKAVRTVQKLRWELVHGGNVPGGHRVLSDGKRKPFITPMKECNSIPLRHSDVVVDIGAYVGTYAIRCSRFPVKKVIAYEPTPRTFEILSLTEMPNLVSKQIAVVGDDTSEVSLHISRGIGVTNSIVLSNQKMTSVTVPAIRYEDAVKEASVVKIDVEGAEYDYDIIQPQLRAIIIDFHPVGKDWQRKADSIRNDLHSAGFEEVIAPNWSCGWTCAGSYIRPIETFGECETLMIGDQCCGCGVGITGVRKSLCLECFEAWGPRFRKGFEEAGYAR